MELMYQNKKEKIEIMNDVYNSNPLQFQNTNYLIYDDNYNALKGLLAGGFNEKVDLIYIDPPFNTNQTFVIGEQRASTISRCKEGQIAYEDEKTVEEYLEFLRWRLILMRELLTIEGSIYLHIDYKIGHYVKIIMDEVFGKENFKNDITRIKSNPKNFFRRAYGNEKDLILYYAKDASKNIWNDIRVELSIDELKDKFTKKDEYGYYNTIPLHAPGESNGITGSAWRGILPPEGRHWRTNPKEFDVLDSEGKIEWSKTGNPRIKKYAHEHIGKKIQDIWSFKDPQNPVYPTEKNGNMIKQIILQSSKEDSIVMDCFAGGGGTLVSAIELGRKFIGIDNSELSMSVIKKRLHNAEYTYIETA
ncbi:hypothetical protein MASR2M70_21980 [Bacillota bacterium]